MLAPRDHDDRNLGIAALAPPLRLAVAEAWAVRLAGVGMVQTERPAHADFIAAAPIAVARRFGLASPKGTVFAHVEVRHYWRFSLIPAFPDTGRS